MKQQYSLHNKVIIVDSTFKTNRFNLPLILLVGIDKEQKNQLMGIALIQKETAKSYYWIFSNFL